MMREVANAMITFLRRDLSNGTMKNWIAPGRLDCRCGKIFDERECLYSGATSTSEVWFYDAESMWCSRKEMASIKCEF